MRSRNKVVERKEIDMIMLTVRGFFEWLRGRGRERERERFIIIGLKSLDKILVVEKFFRYIYKMEVLEITYLFEWKIS